MYKKIPYPTSQAIWQHCPSDIAKQLELIELPVEEAIEQLQQQEQYIELVTFLCHALPMRETLLLACRALNLRRSDWQAEELKVIDRTLHWLKEPDEAGRRLAERQVSELGLSCACGWLAQAVFWCGQGSISPIGQPEVMPPALLYAKAAAGAINTAAAIPEWSNTSQYQRQVVSIALDIANGGLGETTTSNN